MRVTQRPSARDSYLTLQEIVERELRDQIVSAKLLPGTRIREPDLAEQFDVSRGPVRESIRALQGEGLVYRRPGHGTYVARLSWLQLREVYDMRIWLEGPAARLGVLGITQERLDRLEYLLERMDHLVGVGKIDEWLPVNDEFHATLYEASRRERLCKVIGQLMNVTKPYARLYVDASEQLMATHASHRSLFEAVAAGEADEAAAVTVDHLGQAAEAIVMSVQDETM
jgi:DNA-binding GntR family transcriptional regulator